MISLTPFQETDFDRLINWIDNPELLVTIAGNVWSYPLTATQLQHYRDDPKSHAFNLVVTPQEVVIGHAEIIPNGDGSCKIDKLLVDPSYRGKGLCVDIMNALSQHAFGTLNVHSVELNVFDWNTAGIRCYERAGFSFNYEKTQLFKVGDKSWTAVNMSLTRDGFLSMR